ncbi:shikimate dehydrogenase [Flavobacteriaceae bacterium]|nr:shikimate dehydrogenase [Flavobacteriaceae bacterium]MDB4113157.1 shikimate dehydrogenase [Flavobacteriaceae bacterium]MDB4187229.1 shikimate dehydrogenase [Flavobacteriaceae bacterium]MDB9886432.1 shikimate dehydrogenase [Flavobacteriaceae bacterium]
MENNKQRKFGLLGKDIDYSFSRNYFAEKFARENHQNHQYDNYDCTSVAEVLATIERNDLAGLNVTIPYKENVIQAMDSLSPQAAKIGAVNTILFGEDGQREGHNTDAYGFERALFDQWNPNTQKALILGTGGASKAVKYVLEQHNIQPQYVSRIAGEHSISYDQLNPSLLQTHLLIINCTPVGTFPKVEEAPAIDYRQLTAEHFLFDLIYNPAETKFMQLGRKNGAKAANGSQMLIHQAERSWELWNGR